MLRLSPQNKKIMQYSLGSSKHSQFLFPMKHIKICQSDSGASCHASIRSGRKRAVLTVEAALVLTAATTLLLGLISLLDLLWLQQGVRRTALVSMQRQAAYAAATAELVGGSYDETLELPESLFLPQQTEGEIHRFVQRKAPDWISRRVRDIRCSISLFERTDDYLTAKLSYKLAPLFWPTALDWQETVRIRKWTGRRRGTVAEPENGKGDIFLSRYPSVYHTKEDSRYLHVSYRAVPRKWVHLYRNRDGKSYQPSRYNTNPDSIYVFITEYGTTYHDHIDPALTRNYSQQPLEEIEDQYRPAKGD